MNGLAQLLPFVLIAAVFWFLLIRPQRRRQAELASTQRAVEPGDEVMLGSGIVGRIASTGPEFVQLEVSPGVEMRVARAAVVRRLSPEELLDAEQQPDDLDRDHDGDLDRDLDRGRDGSEDR